MSAKYFSIIRNYVLSVSLQRKYNFYHQNILLDAFRMNSRNVIGRNPLMVIPLLANQDLTPMLYLVVAVNSYREASKIQKINRRYQSPEKVTVPRLSAGGFQGCQPEEGFLNLYQF